MKENKTEKIRMCRRYSVIDKFLLPDFNIYTSVWVSSYIFLLENEDHYFYTLCDQLQSHFIFYNLILLLLFQLDLLLLSQKLEPT